MKKIFINLMIVSAIAAGLTACGGGNKEEAAKEEGSGDAYGDYETSDSESSGESDADEPAGDASSSSNPQDLINQGQALVDGSDCKTCHHATNKLIGPAHNAVAEKYEFTKANISLLAGKIINGGSGNWGEIPMSPHPDISKGDAEKMAMYVLSLDGEQPKD
jgi:cytochrome c